MKARTTFTPPNLIFFVLLITASHAFSQELPTQVIPPSPTAAALAVYGGHSVNRYTGVPDIEIPLHTIMDQEIQVPISLKYNAQGIKVQQDASWVGLGWSLLSGGLISRSVLGLDDFDPGKGFIFYQELPGATPDNDLDNADGEDINYLKDVAKGLVDGEPDAFYYNFGIFSGELVFKKQESYSNIVQGFDVRRSTMLFQYNLNTKAWTVKDNNGVRYYFGTKETSEHYSTSSSTPLPDIVNENNMQQSEPTNGIPSSWYLDSIVGPSGAAVYFEYDNVVHQTRSAIYQSERKNHLLEVQFCGTQDCFHGSSTLRGIDAVYSASMQITDDVYLKMIRFKSGKIEFLTADRIDQSFKEGHAPPQKLTEIRIFSENGDDYDLFKTYRLDHSYYNEGANDYLDLRLRLDRLHELTPEITNPPYIFNYLAGTLPPKDSKSFDHWGYYNGKNNHAIRDYVSGKFLSSIIPSTYILALAPPVNMNCSESFGWDNACLSGCTSNCNSCWDEPFDPKYFFGADREPNPAVSNRGLLEKITYPTGGYTAFEYEPNKYYDETVKFKRMNLLNTEVDNSFSLSTPAFVFIDAYVYNDFPNGSADILIKRGTDVISYYTLEGDTTRYEYRYLPAGTYQIEFQNEINSPMLGVNIDYLAEDDSPVKYGPGLRIKSLTDQPVSGVAMQTHYEYEGDENSTGKLMSPLLYQRYEIISNSVTFVTTGCAEVEQYLGHYAVRSGNTILPLSTGAQGSFVGYSSVREVSNGWTTYHYINNPDILPERILPGLPTRADMKNGLVARLEVFDSDSTLLKSVDYAYLESAKDSIKGVRTYHYHADVEVSSALVKFYDVPISNIRRSLQVDSIFASNGLAVERERYYYDNPAHNFATRVITEKNGERILVKTRYPLDYDTSTAVDVSALALKGLLVAHILSPVVEQQVLRVKDNGSRYLINANVNRYKNYGGGIIRHEYAHKLVLSTPSLDTTLSHIDGNGNFVCHGQYDPIAETGPNRYDVYGNLRETILRNGSTISYIWGYDGSFPVAKIMNASYSAVEGILGENFNLMGEDGNNLSVLQVQSLRNSLPNALITSYTYHPLKGITSETDPNGITTFYEYDGMGRLRLVRDQKQNILKRYSYQYKVTNNAY